MDQQQNNFMGGFLIGTVVGGVLGGLTGVLASSRLKNRESISGQTESGPLRSAKQANSRSIESTRRSLEDKIAQLNEAIDDVREQLNSVEASSDNGDQAVINDGP
ncbi:MAG: hypothetical protein ACFB5Z_14720 [Elainellaceae cyanobacterium]